MSAVRKIDLSDKGNTSWKLPPPVQDTNTSYAQDAQSVVSKESVDSWDSWDAYPQAQTSSRSSPEDRTAKSKRNHRNIRSGTYPTFCVPVEPRSRFFLPFIVIHKSLV